jgi:hypothetical protein
LLAAIFFGLPLTVGAWIQPEPTNGPRFLKDNISSQIHSFLFTFFTLFSILALFELILILLAPIVNVV